MNLSAVVLTRNEEKHIIDCLDTLDFCDEVIIVDDKSTDNTKELIEKYREDHKRIKLFEHELNNNFSKQREFGVEKTNNDWVLFVDADERIPKELAQEIIERLSVPKESGFLILRTDFMWDKELKHGDSGNTRLLRLFDKTKGGLKGKVHEVWETRGEVGYINSPILHYPHPTITDFLKEINFYSTIRAEELHSRGKRTNFFLIVAYPKAKFIKNYFISMGFLDGTAGFVHAMLMSFYSFLVRGKLWLLWEKNKSA
jgi:glycosyltransferase involved in cell wall biosynthesis